MNAWDQLFAQEDAAGTSVPMRVLRKQGRPFLVLPSKSDLAARCLDLYPAQTFQARAAKQVLTWLLRCSIPLKLELTSLRLNPEEPFVRFLASTAGVAGIPGFGFLAGNPANNTQRYIFLLFDPAGRAVAVVKAGLSDAARSLVRKEISVLAKLPPDAMGMPKARSQFQGERLDALALDFVAGESPRADDEAATGKILASWINSRRTIALQETEEWTALEKAKSELTLSRVILDQLRALRVQPVLYHGDFAPWNIKVSPDGKWTVLDWERGSLAGIPGWDWFHYFVQTRILVQKQPIAKMIGEVERLLASAAFKAYSGKVGITSAERALLLAYLLHSLAVIKPAEGLMETRELFQALSQRRS